jgi:CRP/FNR family transcriptional regulator, anaerobic regulatory protein
MTNNIVILGRDNNRQPACQSCMRRTHCPVYDQQASNSIDQLGKTHIAPRNIRQGQHVFNAGDEFDGIYMVRSGFFKSYFVDADGEIQVTGFHFPGELFGIDGIETGQYNNAVEALDTGSICKIPFSFFTDPQQESQDCRQSNAQKTRLMAAMVRVMSKAIARDRNLIFALGKMNAKRRFAAFLVDMTERMAQSGYSANEIRLCMGRIDIANYLCLAMETVSRLFTLFQSMGILEIKRRDLVITDMKALQAIVDGEPEAMMLLDKAS